MQAAAQHPPPARGENPPLISAPVLVPPPDLDEDTVFALDTDYKNYLFLCMKNAATPGQSLVCQYLGTRQAPGFRAEMWLLGPRGKEAGAGRGGLCPGG